MLDELDSFQPPLIPPSINSFLLSFEGIEGAGKTTQILATQKFLEEQNFKTFLYREPGGTPFGEYLRKALLQSKAPLSPMAEAHAFAASRAQLMEQVILEKLKEDKTVVILDRHIDSSIAYQGYGRNLGIETILKLHSQYPLTICSHQTFYLRISTKYSEKRQKLRGKEQDYFESENKKFYEKLIQGYDYAAKLFPKRIVTINGEDSVENVFETIKSHLKKLIK